MCEFNPKNKGRRLDPCMKPLLKFLRELGYETVASCCGHSKYKMTVVIRNCVDDNRAVYAELLSGEHLERERRFYKTDKQGIYFIPEVM